MPEESQLDFTTWVMNNAMPDELFPFQSGFDVQSFLKKQASFLQNYKMDDGTFYSDWLTKECQTNNLNPKIILDSLQKEQSLVSMKSQPSKRIMDRALGFGMTDSGDMKKYYGFAQQNISAIDWFVRHQTKAAESYNSGKPLHITVDQNLLTVLPLNALTYVLYLYTPWTGAPDSTFYTKWGSHGVYLFWRVWKMYWYDDLKLHKHIASASGIF